jgi:TonB family protein
MPEIATQQGLQGTTQVKVTLDSKGNVTDVSVYKSAGAAVLDQAALKAAKQTAYTPEIVDCVPTGGSYIFRADFTNQ